MRLRSLGSQQHQPYRPRRQLGMGTLSVKYDPTRYLFRFNLKILDIHKALIP